MDRIYGFCVACGSYVYRIPGMRHGDGQQDTDENPVWLFADEREMTNAEKDQAYVNKINCGCNA